MPDNCWYCGEPIEGEATELANAHFPEDDVIYVHPACAEALVKNTREAPPQLDKWRIV